MKQESIRCLLDVMAYLRDYAVRSNGNQPLAIGVTPDAWKKIHAELEIEPSHRLLVCGVMVVCP